MRYGAFNIADVDVAYGAVRRTIITVITSIATVIRWLRSTVTRVNNTKEICDAISERLPALYGEITTLF